MAVGASPDALVMYVSSEPGQFHGNLTYVEPSFMGRLASMVFIPSMWGRRPFEDLSAPGHPEDDLSPQQAQCVRLVLDIASKSGRSVHLIDVSRQEVPQSDLESRLGGDRFPILVRPDGARLSGEEAFTPGRVRRFVSGS